MEIRAHLRFLQVAPRKVRLVVDLVRGLPVGRALEQLESLPKRSSEPVIKLIKSAMANAEHNFQLNKNDLVIKTIVANEGPRLKRYRARAFGRAAVIQKRLSHVTVVLEDRGATPAKPPAAKAKADPTDLPKGTVKHAPAEPTTPKLRPAKSTPKAEAKTRQRSGQDPEIARKGEA